MTRISNGRDMRDLSARVLVSFVIQELKMIPIGECCWIDPKSKKMNKTRYTTTIGKGAGMIEDTRRLLEHRIPGESLGDFTYRIHNQGLLGYSTACRTGDIIKRIFNRFFKPNNGRPADILQQILISGLPSRVFTELLFVFMARQDPLVYDFTVCEYWSAVRRGRTVMKTDMVLDFLSKAHYDGRLRNQWSQSVSIRVARGMLRLLRDVGFLHGRGTVNYHISDEGAAILARELHEKSVTDSSIGAHPDWRLFGMTESEVLERLDRVGEHRGVIVQRGGSVVHFTWVVKSIGELIHKLTRYRNE